MDTSQPLINLDELVQTHQDELLLVDCRFTLSDVDKGRVDFRAGHLPGAAYAHLNDHLSNMDKQGQGRHPLPDAADFADVLGSWGWKEEKTVVAYDEGGGAMAAARLWYLMQRMGAKARVLNGGLAAWREAGLALAEGKQKLHRKPGRSPRTKPRVAFDDSGVLFTEDLRQLDTRQDIVLIDARGRARFRGEVEPIDPKAGHVPGAINRPFTDNLDKDGVYWRPADVLRREFETLLNGVDPSRVVHMCGSGVTACHNMLAMEYAGLHGSRLYAPSFSGWSNHPENTVATGG